MATLGTAGLLVYRIWRGASLVARFDRIGQFLRASERGASDSAGLHAKFGRGIVVSKTDKFIHIKFTLGEKKFIFPDAFLMGFLEVR